MLFVKIHYGLGNQLFQYALARSLSLRKGTSFALDTTFYNGRQDDKENPRIYHLDQFNILDNIADSSRLATFTAPGFLQRRWRNVSEMGKPYYKKKVVYEPKLDFDADIFKVNDNSYLMGYWQDERYFSAAKDTIRKELCFKHAPSGNNAETFRRLMSEEAVSIHFRRGDYLTDPYTVNNVGSCGLDYYYGAVREIAERVTCPVFYIFSDDLPWAKENFHLDHPVVFVDHNCPGEAYKDLQLMAACRHHILANSSFSWWGAWLAWKPGQIVIAPRVWRSKGPSMFMPEGWRTL
jgi:hypothetical protein